MSIPILTTKLYIPSLRPVLVPRPRLIERLNAGLERKLTLVSAPAGFGKTTLITEWIHQVRTLDRSNILNFCWLSLDENDNDLARFLAYFVAALGIIDAHVEGSLLRAFQGPQPRSIELVLTPLINEIAHFTTPSTTELRQAQPGRSQRSLVFILDDYHLIQAQPIHEALTFLIDHLPPQMHLVITTRADPPLPIARLRGRGELCELRLADLRFTPDETATLLNQVMDLALKPDEVAALANRTEGWIAGLQMAAIALQARLPQMDIQALESGDRADFIQAFTGSHRYVLDYLVEEVLKHQPESVQTFLLQTSILDRLSGPLCDAVTIKGDGTPKKPVLNGQATLELLERANLFIVPLDDERRWYRYHHLFADLLRKRLLKKQPELISMLHLRASRWFEQNGQIAPAIDHALSAGDTGIAARLIGEIAEATLMSSEIDNFINWVEALPEEVVHTLPTLCIYHACALLVTDRPLEVVESRLDDLDVQDNLIAGQLAALRGFIATYRGDLTQALEQSRKALEMLPEDDILLRNIAAWNLTLSPLESDDLKATQQALSEVARAGEKVGDVIITVGTMCTMAKLSKIFGQLHEAADTYKRALDMAVDHNGKQLPIAGGALVGLGELWREWNDLEAASKYLTKGIALARSMRALLLDGYLSLALVRQAQGDMQDARKVIQKAKQYVSDYNLSEWEANKVGAYQARLRIAQGDIRAGVRWAEERGLTAEVALAELEGGHTTGGFFRRKRRWSEYTTLARLLIALERPAETLAYLDSLLSRAERLGLNERVISTQVLRASALNMMGELPLAIATVEQVLPLAEHEGYVRVFVDEGPVMAELLRQAASHGVAPDYATKLLAAFEGKTNQVHLMTKGLTTSYVQRPKDVRHVLRQTESTRTTYIVEPLSRRELEMLRLMGTNLSSLEIAEELFIAPSTVRTHIKNIYRKLDVHRRSEAVSRAKELELI